MKGFSVEIFQGGGAAPNFSNYGGVRRFYCILATFIAKFSRGTITLTNSAAWSIEF